MEDLYVQPNVRGRGIGTQVRALPSPVLWIRIRRILSFFIKDLKKFWNVRKTIQNVRNTNQFFSWGREFFVSYYFYFKHASIRIRKCSSQRRFLCSKKMQRPQKCLGVIRIRWSAYTVKSKDLALEFYFSLKFRRIVICAVFTSYTVPRACYLFIALGYIRRWYFSSFKFGGEFAN